MDHQGHRQRLRERYDQNRFSGFSDHEVLEILLTYAIPRIDVNPLAHRLINAFGSFRGVLEASPEELKRVDGIGERSAAFLTMMVPLFQRYEQQKMHTKAQFSTYSALATYCATLFIGEKKEVFYLLCFDAKMQLIKAEKLASGTESEVHVSPKQVVREAMRLGAVYAAVTHNHPSGDPKPSVEDAELTRAVRDALHMVEIRLVDHVVVGEYDTYSIYRNSISDARYVRESYLAAEESELKRRPEADSKAWWENEE